ncbi:MAG: serine/threonine-protein kinase [Polyangiaceae bacterium]
MPSEAEQNHRRIATAPLGTEAGRAFLQDRIRKFALMMLGLSAFFLVFGNAVALVHRPGATLSLLLAHRGNHLHFAALFVAVAMWLMTRGRPRAAFTLNAVDLVGNVAAMSTYAAMTAFVTASPEDRIDLVMLQISGLTLTARAVIVPSSARQTALVSVATSVPVVGVAYVLSRASPLSFAPVLPANSVLWSLATVVVSTLATRVIFGLRTQVVEAKQLGQYLLVEKIGEGGMGEVHRAQHALLRRPTAVKLLPPDKAGAQTISRFEREVQLTAKLTHPNTVAIYDFGRTPDGIFYYAMELLDGVDLERLVDEHGPQSPARVIHILAQVCGSLSEAHSIGLVHRDVKPANVILCNRGLNPDTAKVVDFGLVKDMGGLNGGGETALSNVDTIVGTPLYLAPEAILTPEALDGRADLYAVGAVGYFLLCGSPVFTGSSVMEVCAEHLRSQPLPPSVRLGRALPRDLEATLLDCLAKKPEDRPGSAEALRDRLLACDVPPWTVDDARRWWQEHGAKSGPSRPSPSGRSTTALAVDLSARA